MSLIRNEQTKLTATFINGLAVAIFAVGGLAPVFSTLYSEQGPSALLLLMSVVCFLLSMCLFYLARLTLRRLEP